MERTVRIGNQNFEPVQEENGFIMKNCCNENVSNPLKN